MTEPKTCASCKFSMFVPPSKYRRCAQSTARPERDGALCGEMRKGACGPEAKLWESADGQA